VGDAGCIVVKVGSSILTCPEAGIDRDYVADLVAQLCTLREKGWQVVLVSSGAISAGLQRLGVAERPTDMPSLQAAASVGQVALVETYAEFFQIRGVPVGQVLLTRHDTGHRESYLHARDTFERLLDMGAVPIVNENDTVAVDEIRFGDNDTLAALVGVMVSARLVVLLTDTEGLYDADPRFSEEATLLEQVEELTDDLVAAAGGAGTSAGSGGMATKVEAAKVLMKAGIPLIVADGRRPDVIVEAAEGSSVGTHFSPGEGAVSAKKLWIAVGRKVAGEIVVDDGAKAAVVDRGKSLLPAGVVEVKGTFAVGDTVVLKDRRGGSFARGLVGLSSADLSRVKGLKSAEIGEVLPAMKGVEVVHRDSLVVL
jgi:glutamate 5-kinase